MPDGNPYPSWDGALVREPVIVDSSIHRAFTVLYGVYVITGALASFSLPPSVQAVGGTDLTRFWILGLAVTAATSLVFSLRESRERKEMISTGLLCGFLAIYSAALLINGIGAGNLDRVVIGTFASSFLVLPMWRVMWFYRKYRKVQVPRG